MVCSGSTLQSITEDQYYLASRANLPISESNELADFEREALLNLVIKDIKNKTEAEKAARNIRGV